MPPDTRSRVSAERLDLLVQLSQAFNSSRDLDTVLNTVTDQVIHATNAERGFVVLRQPDGSLGPETPLEAPPTFNLTWIGRR